MALDNVTSHFPTLLEPITPASFLSSLSIIHGLGAQKKNNCTSMLWLIDSCQNRVSADQYHLTVPRAQVSTHRGRVFLWSYPLTNYQFQMIACSSSIFSNDSYEICCVYVTNWPRTRKLTSFLKIQTGKIFSYNHALITLYVEFLCSDWSKFDRSLHAENLCSILKVVYFDSWSWPSFRCQLVMFLTVFSHWMYKMKYSCYQECSLIHGWFVYWVFGWEMRRLSKFGNPISDGIVFVFHLA